MGRKPKPLDERKTNLFNFSCEDKELMGRIIEIAKRENKTVSDIVVHSLKEYDEKHWLGNYQTLLGSYGDGGAKSQTQLEREVFNKLKSRRQVGRRDVLQELMRMEIKDRVTACDRIMKELHEAGVHVYT